MTVGMARFVVRQHDQAVNSGSGKGLHCAPVEWASGRDSDFEWAKFGWAGMLIGCAFQSLNVQFCLFDAEPEAVPRAPPITIGGIGRWIGRGYEAMPLKEAEGPWCSG